MHCELRISTREREHHNAAKFSDCKPASDLAAHRRSLRHSLVDMQVLLLRGVRDLRLDHARYAARIREYLERQHVAARVPGLRKPS